MPANPDMPSVPTLVGAAVLAFVIFQVFQKSLESGASSLNAIPSVGVPSGPFGFYIGAWNYIKNGRALTEEGFYKYPGKAFKVVFVDRWLVIVNGRALIEELAKAPDHLVSQSEGANSQQDPYQVAVVRTALTRNIGICFPIVRSEVGAAFEDLVPAKTDEWTTLPAMQVAIRTTSKLLHGLRLTARIFGHLDPTTRKAMKHLGSILKHGLEMDDQSTGPMATDLYVSKACGHADTLKVVTQNDLISWLLDEARRHPRRRTGMALNRKKIQGFLHALYNLASNLGYVQPLREEIESVTKSEGWTKAAMGKMVKLDSFLKESARFVPGVAVTLLRQVVKDFTFSDGTTVPAGTIAGVPILAQHHKEAIQIFANERGCRRSPDRFFAVNEQKLIMAQSILTYDFKLKDGVRPEDEWVFIMGAANSTAEVMFKKRG
ncbi:cytochrome P450 [Mycena maculata]|uniref:Cytochrome P450 n=1 Tax=Mycena maculata TaxID=230809 RepID=A0AAD7K0C6_9AGAR|nr:cytochrome P450 [Mycena maculata]